MPNNLKQQRHWGLDIARSFAILSVIYGHSLLFFYPYYSFLQMTFFAVIGVEVFFVLSGFLIGSILLKIADGEFTLFTITHFWARRWLRTLPAYFFVLLVIFYLKSDFYWQFFVFLQNYHDKALLLFPVTWSLTIEEWFYLTFPLLIMIGTRFFKGLKPVHVIGLCAVMMIAFSALLRLYFADDALGWDVVRKTPHLRLDVIGFGIVLAYVRKLFPALLKSKLYFIACLLALIGSSIWLYRVYMQSVNYTTATAGFENSTLFFLIMAVCSVAIVSLCFYFPNSPTKSLQRVFYFISVTSYSTYLVHFQIMNLFAGRADSYETAWLWFSVSVGLSYLASTCLYLLIEKPFLSLRGKLFPK